MRYDWYFGDGTELQNAGPSVQHTYTTDGIQQVTLTVTDNDGDTGVTTIGIVIQNSTPGANANVDVSAEPGETVVLDGSRSSDMDNDPLTYAWSQIAGPPVTLTNPSSAKPSFTAPTGPATLTFELEVCDLVACSTDQVTVTVYPAPDSTPPETRITVGPTGKLAQRTATFRYKSSEPGPALGTFQCRLDGSGWMPCLSRQRYRSLKLGRHVFQVRARDLYGNLDPTPAKAKFKVVKKKR